MEKLRLAVVCRLAGALRFCIPDAVYAFAEKPILPEAVRGRTLEPSNSGSVWAFTGEQNPTINPTINII
jgi:hypothetical protein